MRSKLREMSISRCPPVSSLSQTEYWEMLSSNEVILCGFYGSVPALSIHLNLVLTHHTSCPGLLSSVSKCCLRSRLLVVRQDPQITEGRQDSLSILARKRCAHHSSRSIGTKSKKWRNKLKIKSQLLCGCNANYTLEICWKDEMCGGNLHSMLIIGQ